MNCGQASEKILQLENPGEPDRSLHQHLAKCPSCNALWQRLKGLEQNIACLSNASADAGSEKRARKIMGRLDALDAGRKPDSAPMWAAWVTYPLYRSKNKQINTMEARIKGCFTYSMNAQDSPAGKAPPLGDQIYTDLQTYFHWLAKGAPTGTKLEGAGFFKLQETRLGYDPGRGAQVFQQNCASCHGADGQGQRDINGRVVFPPLWGPHSYNWGAGMASVKNAAGFVKKNMPLGQPDRLTDQQAWDVAAFIDSQERPKDPRQTGSIADAAKQYHSKKDYYGKTVNGHVLGTGTPNSVKRRNCASSCMLCCVVLPNPRQMGAKV